MTELHLASARWTTIQSKAIRSGLPRRPPMRVPDAPAHAVEAGSTVALCGVDAPATDGEPWRVILGACGRCAELAAARDAT